MSRIKDPALAESGRAKIEWVKRHMPVLRQLDEELQRRRPFQGRRLAICLHLEAKTAYMAIVLQNGGASVVITGSNPLSTQDDVAAALVSSGIEVFAWHGATPDEYTNHLRETLASGPQLVIDDGGDLIHLLHTEFRSQAAGVTGGAEETTTGIHRLQARARAGRLLFPVIAVNDARCKYLFDNRLGTGQSVWDGIMRTTNLLVAGKTVVVTGYGWCGRGIALRARGLGARVIVCEVDPLRALEAAAEGYRVMPVSEAAPRADIIISATGCCRVIGEEHLLLLKDGVLLANAGHFDVEIDKAALNRLAVAQQEVRRNIRAYTLSNRRTVYLLADGRLVNLAAGDGHPAEIMDLSFALQVLSLQYLLRSAGNLEPAVIPVPGELDRRVARMKLRAMGITIDNLTAEQQQYLHGASC